MADQPDNLVLVYLRWIDGKVDRLIDDVNDRLEIRVERIERRLDRADATH